MWISPVGWIPENTLAISRLLRRDAEDSKGLLPSSRLAGLGAFPLARGVPSFAPRPRPLVSGGNGRPPRGRSTHADLLHGGHGHRMADERGPCPAHDPAGAAVAGDRVRQGREQD